MIHSTYTSNASVKIFNSPLYHDKYDDGENHLPPLGQGYIVTKLRQNGIPAELIDCVHEQLGVVDIISIINQSNCQNIGFNVFSVNMDLVREILTGINRDVQIFLGGKAIEYLWKEILGWNIYNPITFIIGEGEYIFPDLVRKSSKESAVFDDGHNKVYLINKHSCYYPQNLDSDYLDRTLFHQREIKNKFGRLESCIIASRGCIYNCTFCGGATSANPHTTARVRTNGSLMQEINDIISICPEVDSIRVLDDLFLRNRNSIIDAIQLFASFPELYWRCMAHIKSFVGNEDLMLALKDSGCDEVFIGVESGSDKIRRLINKQGRISEVISVIKSLLTVGINVKGYFMCGFPDETDEQIQATVRLARLLREVADHTPGDFRATAFQFRPYHGTQLYKQLFGAGKSIVYHNQQNLKSAKRQYSFSAGNFSKVDETALDNYINQINLYNK